MKSKIENQKFNTKMETSDWRYSASIVGLIKFFDYLVSMGYEIESDLYEINDDVILYDSDKITEERYLLFVEYYFEKEMHHRVVEQILNNSNFNDEDIERVNKKLKANSVMKRVFKEIKFTGKNKEIILEKIKVDRLLLIKETYRYGDKLYSRFANPKCLFSESNKICRVLNYDIDISRKSKSVAYNWNFKTYNFKDEKEFDFIPFAFTKSNEAFFINNNYSIKQLLNSNSLINNSSNPRSDLFCYVKNSATFIDFDVEIIIKGKNQNNENKQYFETLYIRKDAVKIFEKIEDYQAIKMQYKLIELNKETTIYFEKEVTNKILNNIKLDNLIELLLKTKTKTNYFNNLKTLIKINTLIYGGDTMDRQMISAYASAKRVMGKVPENKINSYKQKLISAITFKDYERFCEILLQLSSYSGVVFDFAYDLFSDFDGNKNIAYTFVNALNKEVNRKNGGEENE